MSGDVAGEIFAVAVPTRIALRLRLQAGALAVVGHHAIGFEFEQILGVQILRAFEWAAGHAHGSQRQRTSDIRDRILDRLAVGGSG